MMALDLETIYKNLLGRPVDAAGAAPWQKDYDNYCLGINENCEIPV